MSFQLLSKHRSRLMGFAMLWVVFFHLVVKDFGTLFWFVHRIGFYGVDIFLLVSGIGLYCSLHKNPAVLPFYGRRALRLLPAFLIVSALWYAFHPVSPKQFFLSVSTLGFWLGQSYLEWFIPTLALLYLLAPWYYRLFVRVEAKVGLTLAGAAVSLLLCIAAQHFDRLDLYGSIVRIPVFLLGFLFGHWISSDTPYRGHYGLSVLSLFGIGLIAAFYVNRDLTGEAVQAGLNCYPALLLAPTLCLLLSGLFERICARWGLAGKILLAPLDFAGRYSLEIYLLHERLALHFDGVYNQKTILLMTIVFAVLLHEAIRLCIVLIRKLASRPARARP